MQFTYKKAQTIRLDVKTESILLLQKRNTPQPQRQTSPQSKGLGNIFQSNGPKKLAGVAILISNKIVFKLKSIKETKKNISYLSKEKSIKRTFQF